MLFLNTDKIIHTIQEADIYALLAGQSKTSYASLYYENHYVQTFNGSNTTIKSNNISFGTVTSRHLNFWYVNKYHKKNNFTEMPIYFFDYLCVNRHKEQVSIFRKLLQTHEYNQSYIHPEVPVSLFKKEIQLFTGVVPLLNIILIHINMKFQGTTFTKRIFYSGNK